MTEHAAGPWIDGPPPKDGRPVLVMFSGAPLVIQWVAAKRRWETTSAVATFVPRHYAEIYTGERDDS